MVTGLRNPAEKIQMKKNTVYAFSVLGKPTLKDIRLVGRKQTTFSKNHPLIRRELGLDWLGREVFSALAQVSLGAAQAAEPPEVSAVSPCCLGKCVLHTG